MKKMGALRKDDPSRPPCVKKKEGKKGYQCQIGKKKKKETEREKNRRKSSARKGEGVPHFIGAEERKSFGERHMPLYRKGKRSFRFYTLKKKGRGDNPGTFWREEGEEKKRKQAVREITMTQKRRKALIVPGEGRGFI